MSDMLREYLTRKNEAELRQALVKMEGGWSGRLYLQFLPGATGEILHVRVKE